MIKFQISPKKMDLALEKIVKVANRKCYDKDYNGDEDIIIKYY